MAAKKNVDNKGIVRYVQDYRELPFGLYMSREVVARPSADWLESWLIPNLGLRISKWHWKSGFARDYDYYLDVVDIEQKSGIWHSTDLYIDITLKTNIHARVEDIDEFVAAATTGVLSAILAVRALETSHGTIMALAGHNYDLNRWLDREGIQLDWLE